MDIPSLEVFEARVYVKSHLVNGVPARDRGVD